jgi:hypothetical protein
VVAIEVGYDPARREPQYAHNIRSRVLVRAIYRAKQRLVAGGANPLPEKITPHALGQTFASVRYPLGEHSRESSWTRWATLTRPGPARLRIDDARRRG